MVELTKDEWLDFTTLKERVGVTDGNLSSHLNSLHKERFIRTKRKFIKGRPNTSYSISAKGKKAFGDHVVALEGVLEKLRA